MKVPQTRLLALLIVHTSAQQPRRSTNRQIASQPRDIARTALQRDCLGRRRCVWEPGESTKVSVESVDDVAVGEFLTYALLA